MKKSIKLITLFAFTLLMSSCSKKENPLTKEFALEHLKKCEAKIPPIISSILLPIGEIKMERGTVTGLTKNLERLKKLKKEGLITLDSISISTSTVYNKQRLKNITTTYYKSALKKQSERYFVKEVFKGTYKIKMSERQIVRIISIKHININRAEVLVEYKIVKTPFYDAEKDNSRFKNSPETYTNTVTFVKNDKVDWRSCNLENE